MARCIRRNGKGIGNRIGMNILFVTSWFPSKLHPTVGNFVLRHAHAVKSVGHRVIVVHEAYSNKVITPTIEDFELEGQQVIHLFFPRYMLLFPRLRERSYQKLFRKLSMLNFTPQVIHGNVLYPVGYLATFGSKKFNTILVFTEHWTGFQEGNTDQLSARILRSIKATAENVDRFLPVSDDLGMQMKRIGIGEYNYTTVNNAVDTNLFYPTYVSSPGFIFLHISTLARKAKNPEGIIRAFKESNIENAQLIIGGDGDTERLKTFAIGIGANMEKINFKGTLEYAEVANLMRNSNCFVLFSNFENLPCVIAESHCCGVPVIATDAGGTAEMIDDENGILIEPGKLEQLKAAMVRMSEEAGVYNSAKMARRASKRYGYLAVGKTFTDVYTKLTSSS